MIDARLSDAGNERERALLRVGAEEAPSARSVQSAARALGLVPGVAAVAFTLAWLLRAFKWSTVATYVVVPAVGAGLIATAYMAVSRHGSTPAPAAVVAAMPAAAPAKALPVATAASVDDRAAPEAPAFVAMARRGTVRIAREVPAGDVEAQVALVDRARALVGAGDASGALRLVDEYGRKFPHGALSEEAALLRIEAVYARGDRAAAASLARRFRAAYPKSVHLDKVQWMVSDGPK